MTTLRLDGKVGKSKLDDTDRKLIMELAAAYTGSTSVFELSSNTGIPVEKVNIAMLTLKRMGYAETLENGEYKLSPKGRAQANLRKNKPT